MNRIGLRKMTVRDASFLLELVNTEAWIKYIGDRNVHSITEAENYIETRILGSFDKNGFGMYLCYLKETEEAFGLCGLVQRDYLDHPDLGFALLTKFEGKGLMKEACDMILQGNTSKLYAICTPDNGKSVKLLQRLGFILKEDQFVPPNEGEVLLLFERSPML